MQTRVRQASLLAAVAGVLVVLGGEALAQSNNDVGTWNLNVAKSKYSPDPVPKSATIKVEPAGGGVTVTVDQVHADGTKRHWEYTGNYDGNDSRVTGTNPDADTVARTRINATTIQTVSKKAGKVTTTSTQVISSDGKTRTITTKGTNGQGQTINNVGVYEKQ
jgi:hypothetical protein